MNIVSPIHRLLHCDADLYRTIRLEALAANPEAFGASFEAENLHPVDWFAGRLTASNVFGAFRDNELAGVAGFYIEQSPKMAHKAKLWGMYVRPDARRSGIGRRLVGAILEAASARAELIQLNVTRGNEAAHRLYASLGFVQYGLEVNALKHDGRYYDEILMARGLTQSPEKSPP